MVGDVDTLIARYYIVAMVPLIVAVAIGLGVSRAPRWLHATGAAALVGVSLVPVVAVQRDPSLQRSNWRAVAAAHEIAGGGTGHRLLVVNSHGTLGQPLHWYLDGGRALDPNEAVEVEQIDIVVAKPTTTPCNLFVGRTCNLFFLGAPPPEPVANHVFLAERIELGQFAIDRYHAKRPLTITAADVVPPNNAPNSLVFLTPDTVWRQPEHPSPSVRSLEP